MDPSLTKKLRREIKSNGFTKCPSCQIAYLTINGLKGHIDAGCKGFLGRGDFVSCNFCSIKFSRFPSMVAHKLKAHPDESLAETKQKSKNTQDMCLKEFAKPVISNKVFVSRSSECSQNIQSHKVNPTRSSENTVESGWTINGKYFCVPNQSPKESSKPVKSDRLFKSRQHAQDVPSQKDNPNESSENTEADGWFINGYFFKKPNQSCKVSAKPVKNIKVDSPEAGKEMKARGWTINGQDISSEGSPKPPVYDKPRFVSVNCSVHGCEIRTTRNEDRKDHLTKFVCQKHLKEDLLGSKANQQLKRENAPPFIPCQEESDHIHSAKRIKLECDTPSEVEENQDLKPTILGNSNDDNRLDDIADKDPLSIEDNYIVTNNIKEEIDDYENNLEVIENEEKHLPLDFENIQHRVIDDFNIKQKEGSENIDLKDKEIKDIADNELDIKEEIFCDTSNNQIKGKIVKNEVNRTNVKENNHYDIENFYLIIMIMLCFLMLWRNTHFR